SVRNVCACPFASVVDVAGSTDPPPDAAAHVTVTPATGFPFASLTSTMCGVCRRVATCPVRLSPELFAIVAAGPAVPVAVKVTGLPVSEPEVAVKVFEPAVALNVQLPTVAMPLPLVVWLPPVIVPFPGAAANVTATCATGFPFASFTITEGGELTAVPAGAVWLVGLFAAIVAAAPAVPVAVKVTGLPARDPDVAVSVFEPAVALNVQLPTVAMPLPLVVWLAPVIVPFPGATANVTATCATGFPFASFTITDGGVLTAVPAVADWLVALFAAIVAAVPAVAVALKGTGDPAPVACTVWVPAVVPSVQVVAAMPLPSLVDVVGLTDPLPVAGVHVTVTPATGLLNRSATRTDSWVGSVVPTVPVCPSPPAAVICDAPAAVALMLNVTVVSLPAIVAVAVVVWVPISMPSVRNVCAWPFASVIDVTGSTDPPPDAAAHVTVTPATGFPFASLTITAGGALPAVPAVADWLVALFAAIVAAAPAVPVAVKVTGLPERDPDVAVKVFEPAVALNVQPPTVA